MPQWALGCPSKGQYCPSPFIQGVFLKFDMASWWRWGRKSHLTKTFYLYHRLRPLSIGPCCSGWANGMPSAGGPDVR